MNGRQHTRDNKMCVLLRFYFHLSFILVDYHQSVNVSSEDYSPVAQFEFENELIKIF